MTLYLKDPQSRVDYSIDWSANYLGDHLITQSSWSVSPPEDGGLIVTAQSHDGRRSAVTVEGGIMGHCYDLTNQVLLSSGERDERSISFKVESR